MNEFKFLALGFALTTQFAFAEGIATDGTMGTAQTLTGTNITIPQTLGSTVGNNLFHSFADFNIDKGQTATFTGSDNLQNVISRVTGGNVSKIDGILKSTIGHADFYFINPNGITFGANASVDVSAAFHVSTADKIDFGKNGGVFYADLNKDSKLSSDAPSAFGFLGTSKANNGLLNFDNAKLTLKEGQTLDVVAGQITVENKTAITAPTGEVRLVSMQGKGVAGLEKTVDGVLPLLDSIPSETNSGKISINSSAVDTSGNGGGRIGIWGGDTVFKDSKVKADNSGVTDAALTKSVYMHVNSLDIDNSTVTFNALNAGNAGNLFIDAKTLAINNVGQVSSNTSATGKAGDVTIASDNLTLDAGYILSNAYEDSSGDAGTVTVDAKTLAINNGAEIASNTFAQGHAGAVTITADILKIDNSINSPIMTGVLSDAEKGSSGNAGTVTITAGTLDIFSSGMISSSTSATGKAGDVKVAANKLTNNSGWIISNAEKGSSGDAGTIAINAGKLDVFSGGMISSSTSAIGNAGDVKVTSDNLTLDGGYIASNANTGSSGDAGTVTVNAKTLGINNGGVISSSTFTQGKAGNVIVTADNLTIDNSQNNSTQYTAGILSNAEKGSSGDAGTVIVNAKNLDISNGGEISSGTHAQGNAGAVTINADILKIDDPINSLLATGIFSTAEKDSNGNAGTVAIHAGKLDVFSGGMISSSTSATGKAGAVKITANNLSIDKKDSTSFTGITSRTNGKDCGSHCGNAGNVQIVVTEDMGILNRGGIDSSTFTSGKAGGVTITSNNNLTLDGGHIFSKASTGSSGDAGTVTVKSGTFDILNGGSISSDTFATGNAGDVTVTANTLTVGKDADISSQASDGSGDAGTVTINAQILNLIDGGQVDSSTFTAGKAGDVTITSNNLTLDGGYISSNTGKGSSGNAGTVTINAKTLNIVSGGEIASSTFTQGKAGSVNITSDKLTIDSEGSHDGTGIFSTSQSTESSGMIGNVVVMANDWLHINNGGVISIVNNANIADATSITPGKIIISAPNINMTTKSQITSQSTGNVAAGNIAINFTNLLNMNSSFITTEANTGNGGSIKINGGELIYLKDSGFKTTVSGENGNGGDISAKVEMLVMDTGLIQANAKSGNGGNINLALQALIPSANTLMKGGKTVDWNTSPSTKNVIQAASQTGVSGTVTNSAPQLNLSGVLANVGNSNFGNSLISQDYCTLGQGSSLAKKGKGGLPLRAKDLQIR
ncbi:MAG: filamentous hemagglutinin N-terminal domain-containing protein [Methylococcales bacterium]|nr:filamentous hemagglutinin N-terminal domain-containing protein [Methylococcales bacterium]MDD5753748.1 filamentous hemagglutinin N-terminal domain-containing protein [Methylococcales bacterium]